MTTTSTDCSWRWRGDSSFLPTECQTVATLSNNEQRPSTPPPTPEEWAEWAEFAEIFRPIKGCDAANPRPLLYPPYLRPTTVARPDAAFPASSGAAPPEAPPLTYGALNPARRPLAPPPGFGHPAPAPAQRPTAAAAEAEVPKTRIWLKGLPADLDYVKLFRSLRNVGPVAAASIHPGQSHADPARPRPSSDVLLTFCRRADCRRFVQHHSRIPFVIDGRVACLTSATDRPTTATERAAADADDDAYDAYKGRTRVLSVEGAADWVNRDTLLAFAADCGVLVDTILLSVVEVPGVNYVEWQLGSIESQAQPLFEALARLAPAVAAAGVRFEVRYGHDPCERRGRFRVRR